MQEVNLNSFDHLTLTKLFYQKSIRNRENLLNGIPTLIPFNKSFKMLSKYIPGITHGEQIIITSNTGVGKSRFTRKIFIKDVVDFAKKSGLKVKVFLNSLEESVEKVNSTLVAAELFNLYGINKANYYKLINTTETPVSKESMQRMLKACEEVDKKYSQVLDIVNQNDPKKFYLRIRDYLLEVGTFYNAVYENGVVVSKKKWDKKKNESWNYYEYHEPTIVIAISDTIDKYQPTEVYINNTKQLLDKYKAVRYFSEVFCRQRLGLVCDVVSVHVSQQNEDNLKANTNVAGKKDLWKVKPNLGNLLTVRAIGQDATLALGIFDPCQHHIFDYRGFDLENMKDGVNYRSLLILKTREGEISPPDDELSLACYFGRDEFEELPAPSSDEIKSFFNLDLTKI